MDVVSKTAPTYHASSVQTHYKRYHVVRRNHLLGVLSLVPKSGRDLTDPTNYKLQRDHSHDVPSKVLCKILNERLFKVLNLYGTDTNMEARLKLDAEKLPSPSNLDYTPEEAMDSKPTSRSLISSKLTTQLITNSSQKC